MSKRKMLQRLLTKTTLNLNGEKIVHDSFSTWLLGGGELTRFSPLDTCDLTLVS